MIEERFNSLHMVVSLIISCVLTALWQSSSAEGISGVYMAFENSNVCRA